MHSGLVIDAQIFASSFKKKHPASDAKLRHVGGWIPHGSIDKKTKGYTVAR